MAAEWDAFSGLNDLVMKTNNDFSMKHNVQIACSQNDYISKDQKTWTYYDVCIYVLGAIEQNYKY